MIRVWRKFEVLSAAAKRQVADFIAFLCARGTRVSASDARSTKPLRNEDFVGMWRDREDLADSTEWVRLLRAEQWLK